MFFSLCSFPASFSIGIALLFLLIIYSAFRELQWQRRSWKTYTSSVSSVLVAIKIVTRALFASFDCIIWGLNSRSQRLITAILFLQFSTHLNCYALQRRYWKIISSFLATSSLLFLLNSFGLAYSAELIHQLRKQFSLSYVEATNCFSFSVDLGLFSIHSAFIHII